LDYWDTIYFGVSFPPRVQRRQAVLVRMLQQLGAEVPTEEFDRLYRASAAEADRWWRDEHRGYTTADRIRWILAQLAIERPDDCRHIAEAVQAVDDTLLELPPTLLPDAAASLRALAARYRLAIVSDTGFASGRAQDRLLEQDGIRDAFSATIYSMDIGHAKPRPEPFLAALAALGTAPGETLHVGDNERTDVGGALAVGMRAIRIDATRDGGPSRAERVVTGLRDLADYLVRSPAGD
jgi:putative hydrolase of the HAD superfamily